MTAPRRLAEVVVSFDELAAALGLPLGTSVVAVRCDTIHAATGLCVILVDAPSGLPVYPGATRAVRVDLADVRAGLTWGAIRAREGWIVPGVVEPQGVAGATLPLTGAESPVSEALRPASGPPGGPSGA